MTIPKKREISGIESPREALEGPLWKESESFATNSRDASTRSISSQPSRSHMRSQSARQRASK